MTKEFFWFARICLHKFCEEKMTLRSFIHSSTESKMTPEQKAVFDFVRNHPNDSVLITGPAGTGKTYLTNALLEWFKYVCHPPIRVAVTGSTGAAAVLIQGRTLHSYMGIGLAKPPVAALIAKIPKYIKNRLYQLHTLVIDEISMIPASLMDIVDQVFRSIRSVDLPFGGVRCIFIGDACQLPPVTGGYFFQSLSWKTLNPKVFQLTRLIRQDGDTRFQELLMRARWGQLTTEDVALLKSRLLSSKKINNANEVQPTRLYSINKDVDTENEKEFHKLILLQPSNETVRTYKTEYYDPMNSVTTLLKMKQYANQSRISDAILLCVGAQVMVTWNQPTESKIVNGTRGVILQVYEDSVLIQLKDCSVATIPYMRIDYPEDASLPNFSDGHGLEPANSRASIRFLPIRLAYALSIHKSQGVTLDCAEIDLGESVFEYGQAYTALSRVKSLESLYLTSFSRCVFRTHPAVMAFYGHTTNTTTNSE